MTIQDAFNQYNLNQGQKELLVNLDNFLKSDDNCFLLKGYAGTGKTFLMKGLTEYLSNTQRQFFIAAPTGAAAKIISQKTNKSAYTLHKTIYSNDDIKEYKIIDEEGGETFKFYYGIIPSETEANAVFIVDESSMVSNIYSEGEFFRFGTGHLLYDLLTYVNFNPSTNKKLIFVGDNSQLPPYNCNFSPALSLEFLSERLKVKEFELTEVIRQEKESYILHNAVKLRNSIKNKNFGSIKIETNDIDVIRLEPNEIENKYFSVCKSPQQNDTIIIAHSNKVVKEYNDFVRNRFFPNQKSVAINDKLIIVANNYNQPIKVLNGDFGTVKNILSSSNSRIITLKRKNKETNIVEEIPIKLTFKEVTITLKDEKGDDYDLDCCILENLLYSENRELTSDEMKALYVYFKSRTKIPVGTREFKDALRSDKFFNAIRVKFGYAITCHKAQGGEWQNVFVNFKTSMGVTNEQYFRWSYTALTRAKNVLYSINTPDFDLLKHKLDLKEVFFKEKENLFILNKDVLDFEIPFVLPNDKPMLKVIFYAIWELIKDKGINLDRINNHSFCEHYHFSNETKKAIFLIYYNKDFKITSIRLQTEKNEFSDRIELELRKIIGKAIIIEQEDETKQEQKIFEFSNEFPFLKELFEKIILNVNDNNIVVEDIRHDLYCEYYIFQKNNKKGVIKFHYKKNGEITLEPDVKASTGLLEELLPLLNF